MGNTVNARPPSGATILLHADIGLAGPTAGIIRILWFTAGAAMLLFTAFLAVLVLAGIGFRIRRGALRQRPIAVFGVSTALVIISTAALCVPDSSGDIGKAFTSRTGWAAGTEAGRGQPARYLDVSGMPVRYANGSASGLGLTQATARSLVLYDATGPDPQADELSATLLVNLASHFGGWTAHPVGTYRAGEMAGYDAVLYLGSPNGGQLPAAFLDDVTQDQHRVVWIDGGIGQLPAVGRPATEGGRGFASQGRDTSELVRMEYKDITLPMYPDGGAGHTQIGIDDPKAATVLATAWRVDGSSVPWAVRSGNLTYVSENPLLSQSRAEGRNLAFADLLFDALSPGTRQRHRALVRLEDVNPTTDPAKLREITAYLAGRQIPFSIGVFPVFRDPAGDGDVTVRLSDRPALVSALAYATAHGGRLVLHGYTHQYATKANPQNGRSGDDAEFYLCHTDEAQQLQLDGHVPEDSRTWALGRIDQALTELRAAGLPKPAVFEFPHYMASATDYLAAGERFAYRYERSLYFPGALSGQPVDDARPAWQMFPYPVRDVYGSTVLPENLDYVGDEGAVTRILDDARANLAVRDGVASFFYHPLLGLGQLPKLVDGLRAMGYTFTAGQDLVASP